MGQTLQPVNSREFSSAARMGGAGRSDVAAQPQEVGTESVAHLLMRSMKEVRVPLQMECDYRRGDAGPPICRGIFTPRKSASHVGGSQELRSAAHP